MDFSISVDLERPVHLVDDIATVEYEAEDENTFRRKHILFKYFQFLEKGWDRFNGTSSHHSYNLT